MKRLTAGEPVHPTPPKKGLEASWLTCYSVTSLIGPLEATTQGVFADILTNDADQSAKKIYIVAAAGPYNSRSAGMRGRAQRLELEKKSKKQSGIPYYQAVHTPGWKSNWAALATFMAPVDKEMVIVTQAIMAILFGSCPRNGYVVCRPKPLVPVPLNWGLNEISPLRLNGLKTYFKGLDTMDPEESAVLRQTRATIGNQCSMTAMRRRQDRLRNGGAFRVYVLNQNGHVVRFHITLMTRQDGAHVDIVLPLQVGLRYGLQLSRTVDVNLELSARNHRFPFASSAAYDSNARHLGIAISGTHAVGSQKGTAFTHWVQSPKKAAIRKAEALVDFLRGPSDLQSINAKEGKVLNSVTWSGNRFVTSPLMTDTRQNVSTPSKIPYNEDHADVEFNGFKSDQHRELYPEVLIITKALQRLSLSRKIRTTPSVRLYFRVNEAEFIASTITSAIRTEVACLILSTEEFTGPRLLSLGGNIGDESQGVYADIITNNDPNYFKVYVGAAGSVGSGRRFGGLRRRIREHLTYAKSTKLHPQSGMLHCNEMTKVDARLNFVVLVRFSRAVEIPLVHISEALMSIFFASWKSQSFLRLRPRYLAQHREWGLNNANPLDFSIVGTVDHTKSRERALKGARTKVARNLAKSIADAQAGCSVRTYKDRRSNNFHFILCKEKILISSTLGGSLGLTDQPVVRVECDIRIPRHPSPYAAKAPWQSEAGKLGICLCGQYSRGPSKGEPFKKWISCDSNVAVARAERLLSMIED
ncbi:uncharacterized protein FMAN_07312 [Fusarium mangiferae]|uniref:GIY-YIG domain-containing protein n=1 Tax=Fusarium mangiferae TaxID=192010 RepID=A0A1L7TC87_FUSMA|nr:uncharacterized protein FMAN_07312 [Fusarium mangiferae]CVK92416.1 uncharacterized protein FMAN_07312 [Fusarium mangiferae]